MGGTAAVGYRHLACASVYGNEAAVRVWLTGSSVGGLRRQEIWFTPEFGTDYQAEDVVVASCLQSLRDLRLEHLNHYSRF